eukprot:SAG11_NODE_1504_length_4782_cov_3.311125_2_plen_302_part_00
MPPSIGFASQGARAVAARRLVDPRSRRRALADGHPLGAAAAAAASRCACARGGRLRGGGWQGRRCVEMVREGLKPSKVVTAKSVENAGAHRCPTAARPPARRSVRGAPDGADTSGGWPQSVTTAQKRRHQQQQNAVTTFMAIGGSTNALCGAQNAPARPPARRRWAPALSAGRAAHRRIHLVAIAGRLGIPLPLELFDQVLRPSPPPSATSDRRQPAPPHRPSIVETALARAPQVAAARRCCISQHSLEPVLRQTERVPGVIAHRTGQHQPGRSGAWRRAARRSRRARRCSRTFGRRARPT